MDHQWITKPRSLLWPGGISLRFPFLDNSPEDIEDLKLDDMAIDMDILESDAL